MNYRWSYFAGAAILVSYFMITKGVPPLAIAAGIGGAAFWMHRSSRSA